MVSSCSATWMGPGWAKMVRIAAATISADPLGTLASTLRRKCTRHRCQAAPISTAPIVSSHSHYTSWCPGWLSNGWQTIEFGSAAREMAYHADSNYLTSTLTVAAALPATCTTT
jgi:hypothetical protein